MMITGFIFVRECMIIDLSEMPARINCSADGNFWWSFVARSLFCRKSGFY